MHYLDDLPDIYIDIHHWERQYDVLRAALAIDMKARDMGLGRGGRGRLKIWEGTGMRRMILIEAWVVESWTRKYQKDVLHTRWRRLPEIWSMSCVL